MRSNFLYNNEAIGLVAILSSLNQKEKLNYSKALLILPLLLNDSIVQKLKRTNTKVLGIVDFINDNIAHLANISDQYQSILPLSISTISLANELKLLTLHSNYILITDEGRKFIENEKELGNRAKNIVLASRNLSKLFDEKTTQLYFSLRIKL